MVFTPVDTDGDGIPDYMDSDTDSDGLIDRIGNDLNFNGMPDDNVTLTGSGYWRWWTG